MNYLFSHEEMKNWIMGLERRASSSAVMCETSDGRLLIVKANYKNHWSLPGGVIDPGESPLQAAVRETEEEVGITLDPSKLEFVLVADRISKAAQTYQFIFKTTIGDDDIASIKLQESEIDEHLFVTKDEVKSQNIYYGKAIRAWVSGESGYVEQRIRTPEDD